MPVKKSRGKVARTVVHGTPLFEAINSAKNRYVSNASAATGYYAAGLQEYLNFYLPKIEAAAKQNMLNNPAYFNRDQAGFEARVNNAIFVAQQTKKIADEWRKLKRQGRLGIAGAYAAVASEEKVIKL